MPDTRHIRAQVKAGARKERILLVGSDRYEIAVREKAERGAANQRVRQLLATTLGCEQTQLRMIKGATSPHKQYLLVSAT